MNAKRDTSKARAWHGGACCCDDRAYQAAVIGALAATIDPVTREFTDADPESVGDCIICKRTRLSFDGPDVNRYHVKIGDMWTIFPDQVSAIQFVREVRAEQAHKEAA